MQRVDGKTVTRRHGMRAQKKRKPADPPHCAAPFHLQDLWVDGSSSKRKGFLAKPRHLEHMPATVCNIFVVSDKHSQLERE